jgi:hypothetical protein
VKHSGKTATQSLDTTVSAGVRACDPSANYKVPQPSKTDPDLQIDELILSRAVGMSAREIFEDGALDHGDLSLAAGTAFDTFDGKDADMIASLFADDDSYSEGLRVVEPANDVDDDDEKKAVPPSGKKESALAGASLMAQRVLDAAHVIMQGLPSDSLVAQCSPGERTRPTSRAPPPLPHSLEHLE